jgi:hypothetical protein
VREFTGVAIKIFLAVLGPEHRRNHFPNLFHAVALLSGMFGAIATICSGIGMRLEIFDIGACKGLCG